MIKIGTDVSSFSLGHSAIVLVFFPSALPAELPVNSWPAARSMFPLPRREPQRIRAGSLGEGAGAGRMLQQREPGGPR
eukprot:7714897-Pyramimonas_sp.AAC.1